MEKKDVQEYIVKKKFGELNFVCNFVITKQKSYEKIIQKTLENPSDFLHPLVS
jgi:predicted patatin/cPLA2 family phospholipase